MDLLCPAVFFPKVAIIKTMSATIAFFSSNPFFLLALSSSPFLVQLIRPKKPAFWRLFTQMTANVVRLVFKKSSFRYSFLQYVSGHWIRSPEWKFLNSLLIRNRLDAKSGYNIFYIRWRNKIEPSSLQWILYSRWKPLLFYPWRSQPCSSHFSDFWRAESVVFRALYDVCLALLPIFPEQSWVLEWIRMRVGYAEERANSIWIRIRVDVEIFKSAKKYLRIKKYPDTYNPSMLEIESVVYVRKEK